MAGWYTVPAPAHEVLRRLVPHGRLTPRDQQVLLGLARAGSVPEVTLARNHFNGHTTYARQRLRQLQEWQLITNRGGAWKLLARGRQVVEALLAVEEGGLPPG